jgi:nucleoside-diphosphate-sugar epimerase
VERPRALVTGASGFVGQAVVPLLVEAGYEVHAVHATRSAPPTPGVRAHGVDLTEPGAAEALVGAVRPSHLLHLAWYTAHGRYWTSERNLDWLAASVRLLRAFAAAGGLRAVGVGTCAEYDLDGGRVCSEATTPRRPASLYGACKNALHDVAVAHAAVAAYSAAWARLFYVYGPAEPPTRLVPAVVTGLLAGRPVELSHGRQELDFLYVEDVAAALVRLLGSDVEGAVNVASGEARSVRAMTGAIADRFGAPGDIRFGARAGDAGPPLIVADTTRLREEVGFAPSVEPADAIDRTISWWRRHGRR